ncbi:hypothetical protein [Cellulophaga fucicola]|uniref:DUF5017 domain-containing protein n=1 Tax=Cellulophaga fucicola TaxID=76595 RepID=A0A1K1Q0Q2_9FLAO|nr:hypothetical protein [Cellulophaga fucicola]SFW53313.1 hypothetical protein SAMN05660313_02200 [Cellulophaga fucicola]
MKKIIYSLIAFGFIFTSCDPMEDINKELNVYNAIDSEIGNLEYTFTADDYADFFEFDFPNFSSVDDAKALIPNYLTETYPFLGVTYNNDIEVEQASSAIMTFDWYNKISTYDAEVRELTAEEHNDITGDTYGNFSDEDHIFDFLAAEYPAAEEGDFVSLRYEYYAGTSAELTDGFLFENGSWTRFAGFTPAEYNAMGENFPNFSSHDEAALKIPVTLPERFKFETKEAGDIAVATYELYTKVGEDADGNDIRGTVTYTANFIYNGSTWAKYNNVATETIQFAHDGITWVPDNTIKYTLAAADYALVGNDAYGNFDVREGKDEATAEARLAKINTILLANFPNAEEGQKFSVSYNVYSGSNEVWIMNVILEGGVYVLQ